MPSLRAAAVAVAVAVVVVVVVVRGAAVHFVELVRVFVVDVGVVAVVVTQGRCLHEEAAFGGGVVARFALLPGRGGVLSRGAAGLGGGASGTAASGLGGEIRLLSFRWGGLLAGEVRVLAKDVQTFGARAGSDGVGAGGHWRRVGCWRGVHRG